MDDSQITRLLEEVRELKAQVHILETWQSSIVVQHQEHLQEKAKWLADREKMRQDHLALQARQIRARQWVRLYLLGLFLVVAVIWLYRLNSR